MRLIPAYDPPVRPIYVDGPRLCGLADCFRPYRANGFCSVHFGRMERFGDPAIVRLEGWRPDQQHGERNPSWTGDRASYHAWHIRLRKTKGKASQFPCIVCGGPAREWAYMGDGAEERMSRWGAYALDADRYEPVCRRDHLALDGRSKLTEDDVRAIRTRCGAGERQADLAREYGVSPTTVCRVVRWRGWRNVA